ncbi:MAG: UDP-N-acetylmuramoyl-tripeptide--D-alanyl-D-alanine ligase [Clostridiales Family XIII bacterium]|jgi:UDP-N-acetylmuramyl pentapeptide synthase|nr:UDP-N-acetylmuramoyl-tripeptide--D-alanyl-D-alanine ligase [Clostridiales Family XIII bacterium]
MDETVKCAFARKARNVPWHADELAEFLEGEWIVPPSKDWGASYIVYAGCGSALSKEAPVSVVTEKYAKYPKQSKAFIFDGEKDVTHMGIPALSVQNPNDAMMKLVRFGRESMTGKVVAVTGSVGKTSTKDMLSELLKTVGTCVHTFGSQNTLSGIRSVLAGMVSNPEYAVLEVCSHVLNARLRETVNLIRPDIAVITQVCLAHADELGFGSEADVAVCKARIAENIRDGGVCLVNREIAEYDLVKKTVEGYGARVVSYGLDEKADVWIAEAKESGDGFFVSANIFGNRLCYETPYFGFGFALNSLAALTAVHLLGADAHRAAERFSDLPVPKHRMSIRALDVKGGRAKLIDDCFNAQPLAVIDALHTLKAMTPMPGGRKVAVLGDIRTFSGKFIDEYKTLTRPIVESADSVYLVGKDVMTIRGELPVGIVAGAFADIDEAAEKLPGCIRPNDTVLVKVTSAGREKFNLAVKLMDATGKI